MGQTGDYVVLIVVVLIYCSGAPRRISFKLALLLGSVNGYLAAMMIRLLACCLLTVIAFATG